MDHRPSSKFKPGLVHFDDAAFEAQWAAAERKELLDLRVARRERRRAGEEDLVTFDERSLDDARALVTSTVRAPKRLRGALAPRRDLRAVTYPGPLGPMAALITAPRREHESGPAALWILSDESPEEDLAAALDLADDGFTVMVPALRGQYGNPGSPDLAFGEIDDLRAARDFLVARADVLINRLVVVGRQSAASRALLLADTGAEARAFVVDRPKLRVAGRDNSRDAMSVLQAELRSPARFASHVQSPAFILSADGPDVLEADALSDAAVARKAPVRSLLCPGCSQKLVRRLAVRMLTAAPGYALDDAALEQVK
jgi:dienelactone hydrolase